MTAKTKILLVEDDPNFGSVLKNYLELNDYEVKLCTDGFAGYDQFVAGKFDICILDVMMPRKDGFTGRAKLCLIWVNIISTSITEQ